MRVQFRDEFFLGIYPRVSDDPELVIEREGLLFVFGFVRGFEQGMAKADMALDPDLLGVRTAEAHSVRHPAQKRTIHGSFVQVEDADDSTHSSTPTEVGSPT